MKALLKTRTSGVYIDKNKKKKKTEMNEIKSIDQNSEIIKNFEFRDQY